MLEKTLPDQNIFPIANWAKLLHVFEILFKVIQKSILYALNNIQFVIPVRGVTTGGGVGGCLTSKRYSRRAKTKKRSGKTTENLVESYG
jgi:hypothetical protein